MIIPGGGILSNNVQDAIEEINNNKVSKSGDEINGNLGVHKISTSTEAPPDTWLQLGNEIPVGQVGSSVGKLSIFGTGSKAIILKSPDNMTKTNRTITFPDRDGEVLLNTTGVPLTYIASESDSFTFDFSSQTMYLVLAGVIGGNGSYFMSPSVFLAWRPTNGGTDISYNQIVNNGRTITSATMSGEKATIVFNSSARVSVYRLCTTL